MTCTCVNCVKEYSSIIHKRQQQKTSDQQKASEAVSPTHTICFLFHILTVTCKTSESPQFKWRDFEIEADASCYCHLLVSVLYGFIEPNLSLVKEMSPAYLKLIQSCIINLIYFHWASYWLLKFM